MKHYGGNFHEACVEVISSSSSHFFRIAVFIQRSICSRVIRTARQARNARRGEHLDQAGSQGTATISFR
jgi:hypothetical protein